MEIHQAVALLMSEFQRRNHAQKSSDRIEKWTTKPQQLGAGLTMSGIPLRIFLQIADCAKFHTSWCFDDIMSLPKEDGGYAHDMMHPRFAAVMLQLGDALDMDNDRFHMFTKEFVGALPLISQAHFDKHQSIRQLQINSEEIVISADCPSQEALRLVRQECDSIEAILKAASYHWSEISPPELSGCLPTLKKPILLLKKKEIPAELVTTKFEISQEKAFRLLQGENVYANDFPFLREFVQNALDATKLQCWRDYLGSRSKIINDADSEIMDIARINSVVEPDKYPIEINFRFCKQIKEDGVSDDLHEGDMYEEVTKEDLKRALKSDKYIFGVLVEIKDYGLGIREKDIQRISRVGTSHETRRGEIRQMPDWLRPTGEFGIGLQSAFLVTDTFSCETYTRTGECFKINFNTRSGDSDGYINVEPILNNDREGLSYGTSFRIFLPHTKKVEHEKYMSAWEGKDPFEEDYEEERPLRNVKELISQMLLELNGQLGEVLFPVIARVDMGHFFKEDFLKKIEERFDKIALFRNSAQKNSEQLSEQVARKISWIYRKKTKLIEEHEAEQGHLYIGDFEDGRFALDLDNLKFYVLNNKINTSVRVGIDRLRLMKDMQEGLRNREYDNQIKIYYKGIFLQRAYFEGDNELIELIDYKGRIDRKYLQLSRNGLTEDGMAYFKEHIYKQMIESVYNALDHLDQYVTDTDITKEITGRIKKNIERNANKIKESKDKRAYYRWNEQYMSIVMLYYFHQVHKKVEMLFLKGNLEKRGREEGLLQAMLDIVSNMLREDTQGLTRPELMRSFPYHFVDINVLELKFTPALNYHKDNYRLSIGQTLIMNLADIMSVYTMKKGGEKGREKYKNQYMILSRRQYEGAQWEHMLLKLDERDPIREDLLRATENRTQHEERVNRIESWGRQALDIGGKLVLDGVFKDKKRTKKIDDLYRWMLENIPTIAIFASEDGNQRLNLLASFVRDDLFVNRNMKMLNIKRMRENHDKYKVDRFSICTWDGYADLKSSNISGNVCWINRGYISKLMDSRMVFPIQGSYIQRVMDLYKADVVKELEEWAEQVRPYTEIQRFSDYLTDEQYGGIYYLAAEILKLDIRESPDEFKLIIETKYKAVIQTYFESMVSSNEWLMLSRLDRAEIIGPEDSSVKKYDSDFLVEDIEELKKAVEQLKKIDLRRFMYETVSILVKDEEVTESEEIYKSVLILIKSLVFLMKCPFQYYYANEEHKKEKDRIYQEAWTDNATREALINKTTEESGKSRQVIERTYDVFVNEVFELTGNEQADEIREVYRKHNIDQFLNY